MNFSTEMPSLSLGDIFDALLHPSVGKLPAGFLLLTLAVLGIAALPDDKRQKVRMAVMAGVRGVLRPPFFLPADLGAGLGLPAGRGEGGPGGADPGPAGGGGGGSPPEASVRGGGV